MIPFFIDLNENKSLFLNPEKIISIQNSENGCAIQMVGDQGQTFLAQGTTAEEFRNKIWDAAEKWECAKKCIWENRQ